MMSRVRSSVLNDMQSFIKNSSGGRFFEVFGYDWLYENSHKIEIASRHILWYQDKSINEKKFKTTPWTLTLKSPFCLGPTSSYKR
jgi:hypothetical protein